MSSILPQIVPIDLVANQQRIRDILNLYSEKFTILCDICEDMDKTNTRNWKYFEYLIEMWQLKECVTQGRLDPLPEQFDAILMAILKDKLKWIISSGVIGGILEQYFTSLYIKEGYYGIAPPQDDEEYEDILDQELQLLDQRIHTTIDDQIRIFYIKQELNTRDMAKKKIITKQESDNIIHKKVKDYSEIINLLREKQILLQRVINDKGTDELTRINNKIEIIKLQREIESKTEFRKRYVERKNIIS
jgi:hypothetical protein